ncbi:cytosine permease [Endozoicomonas sp. 4G]|uniref:cytosine permease n=1 Tax=Endozoicomonas sp. 4G TaxID=2872754 RepID=UPI0020790598|nr:cytosine permease [Endozoicomonas sp. 4G]
MKYQQAGSQESESLLPLKKDFMPAKVADRSAKQWCWFDYASLWSGIVICVSGYSIGALLVIKYGLTIQQSLVLLVLCGFAAFVLSLMTAAPGYEHRANTVSFLYQAFGRKGVLLPVIVRMMVCCGWFGVHCLFGGMAIHLILSTISPLWMDLGGAGEVAGYFIFLLLNVFVFRHGFRSLIKLQCFCAPLLLIVGVLLMVWANHLVDFSALGANQADSASAENMLQAAVIVCGSWFSFTFFMSDFSRFSRSKADYVVGQFIGFYLSKLLFGAFGVLLGAASVEMTGLYRFDIVSLINEIEVPIVKLLGLMIVLLATLTTTVAACLATSSVDLESLVPRIERHRAITIVSFLATAVALPELLYKMEFIAYGGLISLFTDFLKVYSSIINGMIVIFLLNYYVKNRQGYKPCEAKQDYHWKECILSILLVVITLFAFISTKYSLICFYSGFLNVFVVLLGYLLFDLMSNKKTFLSAG